MQAPNTSGRAAWFALLGFLLAFPCMAGAIYLYIRYGNPPVATADHPFPDEKTIVHIPLHARIHRDLVTPPTTPEAHDLVAGAQVYVEHCAICHGSPHLDSSFGKWEYPTSPQLWRKHKDGVVGVSDDAPNVSYWKVENGIRLTGMPSFQHILSNDQMWQVSFLVAQADHPLSPQISAIFDAADTRRRQDEGLPTTASGVHPTP